MISAEQTLSLLFNKLFQLSRIAFQHKDTKSKEIIELKVSPQ